MHSIPVRLRRPIQLMRGKSLYRPFILRSKVIFIHIPKAAGSSVGSILYGTDRPGHYKAWEYQWENPKKFSEYYKFSIVRNPYDRICSAFYFLKQGGKSRNDSLWAKKNLASYASVNDFVLNALGEREVQDWIHFIPQYLFICDEKGEILVDDVFKLEAIQNHVNSLNANANINIQLLPKLNQSISGHPLTSEAKTTIRRIYSEDFRVLGYE